MSAPEADGGRQAELARIHIARKELGLDDDAYRSLLASACGVESSKELDATGRRKLLEHFRHLGWKPAPMYRPRVDAPDQAAKIRALWVELDKAGALRDGSDRGLARFCKRMTGFDRPEWLYPDKANKVIEALKAWLERIKS